MTQWPAIARGLVLACLASQAAAQSDDDAPLSAIDWLSESVEQPAPVAAAPPRLGTQANRTPPSDEAPVAGSAATPNVTIRSLNAAAPRALGLLPPSASGLPMELWQNSDEATLTSLLLAEEIDTLPALQDLLITLTLAEANPPTLTTNDDMFLLARVDKLLSFGALEQAQALLEVAKPDNPALFRRWFDVSLLTGTEDAACRYMQDTPDVAPTPAARIFCLARSGDWSAAALTLNTGRALGDIPEEEGNLLARFLDPDLFETEPDPTPPSPMTPLTYRMFEAVGVPLGPQGLPRAFSHADLRPNAGWKAQLEAAERLAKHSALSSNALIGLYTARVPAASGGVWERAKAVNALTAALEDGENIGQAAERLWDEAEGPGLLVPLAAHFAPDLIEAEPEAGTAATLFKWLLLSDQYEAAALRDDLSATDPFLAALARGTPDAAQPSRPAHQTLQTAFAADPDAALVEMSQSGRSGEAILRTIATLQQGLDGDVVAFGQGIATLRALGLEDTARRVALQYAVLR